jgi:hypothetical protein
MDLPNLSVSEIKERAEAIAWTLGRLCIASGITAGTIYRTARDPKRDIRRSTQLRLLNTLVGLERDQLRRLARLHPDVVAELAGRLEEAA